MSLSIISICVEIGRELRKTKIGKQALADYEVINAVQNSEKNYLYLESLSKHRTKYHFFSPDAALKLIEANVDSERVGSDCRLIAQDEAVQRFAKSMIQLGGIVRNFPEFAMSPQVRYSMPPAIDAGGIFALRSVQKRHGFFHRLSGAGGKPTRGVSFWTETW